MPARFRPQRVCLGAATSWCLIVVSALAISVANLGGAALAEDIATPAEPLHQRIDALIEAGQNGLGAPLSDDAEFLRRVWLDLAGQIPAVVEARAFLDDPAPEKRPALIRKLLASPEFARRMQYVFDVLWMERRPDKHVPAAEWQEFLRSSFEQNKPYDQLVREILLADGGDGPLRPAAKFYLDREAEPNSLTRDVGRLFLGHDLQCAQCHNHPLIESYHQSEYFGILAFLNRSYLFTDANKKVLLAEKAEGEVNFKSVFTGDSEDGVVPQLPGDAPLTEPLFESGQEYDVAPADGVRPIPKFSRRTELARLATCGTNAAFNRNAVNRLWALLMGRGIVDPVDLQHADNPPSHPELLDLLAQEFVVMKFDVRALLEQIALSRAYQRASDDSRLLFPPNEAIGVQLAALEAESARLAGVVAAAGEEAKRTAAELAAAKQSASKVNASFAAARKAETDAKAPADAAAAELVKARDDHVSKQTSAGLLAEAAAKSQTAAQNLPDDKELAAAVSQIQTRASEWAAQVEAATRVVAEREVAVKAAADALAAAHAAADQAAAAFQVARDQVQQFDAAARSAEQARAVNKLSAGSIDQQVLLLRLLPDRNRLLGEIATAELAAQSAANELEAARKSTSDMLARVDEAEKATAEAQSAADLTASMLLETETTVATRREVITLVAEASAKAQMAADRSAGDPTLAEAAAQLKTRGEQLAADMAPFEADLTERKTQSATASEKLAAARARTAAAHSELAAARQHEQASVAAAPVAVAALAALRTELDANSDQISQRLTARALAGALRPLSPEQLAWTVMQATGVTDAARKAAETEVAQQNPPDPALSPEQQQLAQARLVEKALHEKLKAHVATFVSVFGQAAPSSDFQATVHQALFFANGGLVTSWVAPGGDNLAARLAAIEMPNVLAEELYLAVLSRRPRPDEIAAVESYLSAAGADRGAIVSELIWAMLSSNEFRFNH